MNASRAIYALITLAALAFPVRRFVLWLMEHGPDAELAVREISASYLSLGLTGSLVLTSLATLVFIVGECITRRDRLGLIAVPVTLCLGSTVGLPFYLCLRLRPVE